ncbi:hypothetical protein [Neptuniibacter halophilus]|uniref:hypothetical protein n=1 Tax=Neptuniibacter halophilus TaxID=651666 RepID=UPI002572995F|nr:hypothetical protein [Neptuniibacter halophilus]
MMPLQRIKAAAEYLASKPEQNRSEQEMWAAIATPQQVLELIERIEYLEQSAGNQEAA